MVPRAEPRRCRSRSRRSRKVPRRRLPKRSRQPRKRRPMPSPCPRRRSARSPCSRPWRRASPTSPRAIPGTAARPPTWARTPTAGSRAMLTPGFDYTFELGEPGRIEGSFNVVGAFTHGTDAAGTNVGNETPTDVAINKASIGWNSGALFAGQPGRGCGRSLLRPAELQARHRFSALGRRHATAATAAPTG